MLPVQRMIAVELEFEFKNLTFGSSRSQIESQTASDEVSKKVSSHMMIRVENPKIFPAAPAMDPLAERHK